MVFHGKATTLHLSECQLCIFIRADVESQILEVMGRDLLLECSYRITFEVLILETWLESSPRIPGMA